VRKNRRHLAVSFLVILAACIVLPFLVSPWSPGPVSIPYPELRRRLAGEPIVRVLLGRRRTWALQVSGAVTVTDPADERRRVTRNTLHATVSATGGQLSLAGITAPVIRLQPDPDGALAVGGRRYRGGLLLRVERDGGLAAINWVRMEAYVAGVVGREMVPSWPPAALQAQAIASRTFALYQSKRRAAASYDVSAVQDQLYGGVAAETRRVWDAVHATRGQVLVYRHYIVPTFFHAVCGGRTSDVHTVFDLPTMPPLAGVACGYCAPANFPGVRVPSFKWRASAPVASVVRQLQKLAPQLQGLRSITVWRPDAAGRGRTVRIIDGSGRRFDVSAFQFRRDLRDARGRRLLKSTAFTSRVGRRDVTFSGRGWGHGAGMCAWGAAGMAKAGRPVGKILAHYYPGAKRVRAYGHEIHD